MKTEIRLTREQAANTAVFKAAAEESRTLRIPLIVADPADPSPPVVFTPPPPLHVPHGASALEYRSAKAQAVREGRQIVFDPAAELQWQAPAGAVVIPPNADVATYRRMKADAESRGVPYCVSPV